MFLYAILPTLSIVLGRNESVFDGILSKTEVDYSNQLLLPPNTDKMASSLKQVIVSAINKVVTSHSSSEFGTPEEARDNFIACLIAELFPESPSVVEEKKKSEPKKPRAKKVPEAKVEVIKTESEVVPEVVPEVKVDVVVPEVKVVEVPKKAGRKKAEKPEGPVNIPKLNPTQSKKLKQLCDELKVTEDKKGFLTYLNGLSTEDFESKKLEDHIRNFLKPTTSVVAITIPTVPTDLVIVEFEGKDYYVNEESKRVYLPVGEFDADGQPTSWDPVGYVGMAAFKDIVVE